MTVTPNNRPPVGRPVYPEWMAKDVAVRHVNTGQLGTIVDLATSGMRMAHVDFAGTTYPVFPDALELAEDQPTPQRATGEARPCPECGAAMTPTGERVLTLEPGLVWLCGNGHTFTFPENEAPTT